MIPLDDASAHTELLLGVSMLLFRAKGPDFFCMNAEDSKTAET